MRGWCEGAAIGFLIEQREIVLRIEAGGHPKDCNVDCMLECSMYCFGSDGPTYGCTPEVAKKWLRLYGDAETKARLSPKHLICGNLDFAAKLITGQGIISTCRGSQCDRVRDGVEGTDYSLVTSKGDFTRDIQGLCVRCGNYKERKDQ